MIAQTLLAAVVALFQRTSQRLKYSLVPTVAAVEGLALEQVTGYDLVPGDAVLREFIGGSTIKIPHNE